MKSIKIDVIDFVPLKTHVDLNPDFRVKLFNAAIASVGTKRKLARIISTNETSIYEWEIGKKKPPLDKVLKCGEIAQIDRDTILKKYSQHNILGRRAGTISIKNWKLFLDEKLSEWLGLLKGDGTITKYYISLSNNCIDIIFFFTKILEEVFGVSKKRVEILIRIPSNKKQEKETIKLLLNKGFEKVKSVVDTSCRFKRQEPNILVRVNNVVLVQLVSNLMLSLHKLLRKSPTKVKIGFIKGFVAAEGSPWESRGYRGISISQKGTKELWFIKSLLKEVGINHVSRPIRLKRNYYHILITTRKELEKLKNLIGFGFHSEKNKRLEEIVNNYQKNINYHLSTKVRYKQILNLLKEKHANILLNQMLDRKMVCVDRCSRPFAYFLSNSPKKKKRMSLYTSKQNINN
jgi:hypothetical protein